MHVLIFSLEAGRYGIRVSFVREIVRAVAIASLPGGPELINGIINLRGRLVPVLDLRRRFGHPHRPTALSDFFVIADAGSRDVALHVDDVVSVQQVPEEALIPATDLVRRSAFVGGLAALPDGTLMIQDPSAFLAEAESDALEAALAEVTAA